jgi:FkbM family methyltransferase
MFSKGDQLEASGAHNGVQLVSALAFIGSGHVVPGLRFEKGRRRQLSVRTSGRWPQRAAGGDEENETVKQSLLGSPFGRMALSVRDKIQLVREAWSHPERVGTSANDHLATYLITRLCRPNAYFIDVGAHIGSIISEVVHRDRSIKIVAVEAIPEKAERLRRKFPDVETHACAVGESAGNATFFIDMEQSGYSSLGTPKRVDQRSIREINVRLEKLDALVPAHHVDAIKIDVEGAELGVLRGATALLARCRPLIMFESGAPVQDGLGYSKEAMYEFLSTHDFSIVVPNRVAHNDDGLDLQGFVESHLYPRRTTNYFAIPKERRLECRDLARRILGVRPEI